MAKSKKVPVVQVDPRVSTKAKIYENIQGLTIGQAVSLLTEITREQLAQDPNLNIKSVQDNVGFINQASTRMAWQDLAYLLTSGLEHIIESHLTDPRIQ